MSTEPDERTNAGAERTAAVKRCDLCALPGEDFRDQYWLCRACCIEYLSLIGEEAEPSGRKTRRRFPRSFWAVASLMAAELSGGVITMLDENMRRSGIGGSDVAAILGLDSRRDGLSVWMEKQGMSQGPPQTWRMKFGKLIEQPAIEEAYPELTGRRARFANETVVSSRREWMRFTPDGFCIDEQRGIEMKLVSWDQRADWSEDTVPERVECQVRFYMAATEYPVWDVLAVFGMDEPRVITFERDLDIEDLMLEALEEFWQRHIVGGERPPLGNSPAAAEYLRQRFPRNRTKLRLATTREVVLLEEYAQARSEERDAASERTRLENELKFAVGDSDGIEWSRGKFTWRATKDVSKTDYESLSKRLLSELPEDVRATLLGEYTVTRPGSRRIHWSYDGEEAA